MYLAVLDAEPKQRCFDAIDRYDIRLLLTLEGGMVTRLSVVSTGFTAADGR
jgi:hypothetical protein